MEKADRQIVLINEIRGDWPIGHDTIATPGVYDAYENRHGAVAVRAGNGEMLGLKPGEFEWLGEAK